MIKIEQSSDKKGNKPNPTTESRDDRDNKDITSSPERRCSSRTFRYGYLVTT